MRYAKPMTFLTPNELLALLKAARGHSNRAWAAILLAYKHGLRCSEVCDLRLDDLDLKSNQVTVRRLKGSMTNVQNLAKIQGQPLLDEPKAVKAWLAGRNDPSPFLFTSQKGGQLDRSAFFRLFQSVAEAAGLPKGKRNPHLVKHSLASHMVAAGTNLAFIRQSLGHMSASSTARYCHVTDEQAATETRKALSTTF
jgi:type 1 fimbriae regulatory protein FimB